MSLLFSNIKNYEKLLTFNYMTVAEHEFGVLFRGKHISVIGKLLSKTSTGIGIILPVYYHDSTPNADIIISDPSNNFSGYKVLYSELYQLNIKINDFCLPLSFLFFPLLLHNYFS